MMSAEMVLQRFAKERPVGTQSNNDLIALLETSLDEMGYEVESLPFDCMIWKQGASTMSIEGQSFAIEPSPFSEPFCGNRKLVMVHTIEELHGTDCKGAILLLAGEITKTPLSPKNYPFYYPDEHRDLIALLEKKNHDAIVAVTGATPLNGKNPFPLFEDGNFLIPSANIGTTTFQQIEPLLSAGATANLTIDSHKEPGRSRQLVASKKVKNAKGKIVLAAHMDSKYDTPGALDNATGLAILLEVTSVINIPDYDIEIVPFNSEEYFGANGELEYLKRIGDAPIALMINIDSPCHIGSQTAVSFYNFSDEMQAVSNKLIEKNPNIVNGEPWYAGDHAPFLFRGIPCMAVTSSDFFEGALEHTHTPKDTLDTVDGKLVTVSAKFLTDILSKIL